MPSHFLWKVKGTFERKPVDAFGKAQKLTIALILKLIFTTHYAEFLEGTVPVYESYMALKKMLLAQQAEG